MKTFFGLIQEKAENTSGFSLATILQFFSFKSKQTLLRGNMCICNTWTV